jgi:hypothetical protein
LQDESHSMENNTARYFGSPAQHQQQQQPLAAEGEETPKAGAPSTKRSVYDNFYRRPTERKTGRAMVPSNISFQRSHVYFG